MPLEKCHDTLWQGGRLEPTTAFNELSKILFVKIRDEKQARRDRTLNSLRFPDLKRMNALNRLPTESKGCIKRQKHLDPDVFTEDIRVDEGRLFSVVNHLQGINLNADRFGCKRNRL